MPFSWGDMKKRSIAKKIYRAKKMAAGNISPNFDLVHPAWVRDGQKKNYIVMTTKITEEMNLKHNLAIARGRSYTTNE